MIRLDARSLPVARRERHSMRSMIHVRSVVTALVLAGCGSSSSGGDGTPAGASGASAAGSGGTGAAGGSAGGTSAGGSGASAGGTSVGGSGANAGGTSVGGSAGSSAGGSSAGGTSAGGTSAGGTSAGGTSAGSGGGLSCAIKSSACDLCGKGACKAAGGACKGDAACQSAIATFVECACNDQMTATSAKPCLDAFAATDATSKGLADCIAQNCAAPCGF